MKKSPAPNLSVGDFKPESYFFYIGDAGYIKRHHCNVFPAAYSCVGKGYASIVRRKYQPVNNMPAFSAARQPFLPAQTQQQTVGIVETCCPDIPCSLLIASQRLHT